MAPYGDVRFLAKRTSQGMQQPAPWFLWQIFLSPVQHCTFLPTKGHDQNFCYRFEYNLYFIKIPSHLNCESIYTECKSKNKHSGDLGMRLGVSYDQKITQPTYNHLVYT